MSFYYLRQCVKCDKPISLETSIKFHGCCCQAEDEDEGICIMIGIPAPTDQPDDAPEK